MKHVNKNEMNGTKEQICHKKHKFHLIVKNVPCVSFYVDPSFVCVLNVKVRSLIWMWV